MREVGVIAEFGAGEVLPPPEPHFGEGFVAGYGKPVRFGDYRRRFLRAQLRARHHCSHRAGAEGEGGGARLDPAAVVHRNGAATHEAAGFVPVGDAVAHEDQFAHPRCGSFRRRSHGNTAGPIRHRRCGQRPSPRLFGRFSSATCTVRLMRYCLLAAPYGCYYRRSVAPEQGRLRFLGEKGGAGNGLRPLPRMCLKQRIRKTMNGNAVDDRLSAARRHLATLRQRAGRGRNQAAVLEEALDGLAAALEALRTSEAQTRAILATAADAIITIDDRGRIESFNPAAAGMFGYSAEEAIGKNVSMLMPSPYREEHDGYIARYLGTGEARIIGVGRELTALRKDGSEIPVEVAVSPVRVGRRRSFTGVLRDISARKRAASRLTLQHAVTQVLAGSASLSVAAPMILRAVCETIGWQVGEFWRVDHSADLIRLDTVWHSPGLAAAAFVASTQQLAFPPGRGLPGEVWASGQALWTRDLAAAPIFVRQGGARELGLRGAYAFPIRTVQATLGVMVFFGRDALEPAADWSQTLDAIGRQTGDFIERKRAEAAMRRSEARFRSIIASNPDGIVVVDPDGIVRFVNPAGARLLGRAENELLGQPFGAPLVSGEATEVDIVRPDGRPGIAEMRVVATEWEGESVGFASLRDITDRRIAEQALRESEARFNAFMSNSPTPAWIKDAAGRYVYMNPALEGFFGVGAAECVGRTDFDILPASVAGALRGNDATVLREDRTIEVAESVPGADGEEHDFVMFKFPVTDEGGRRYVGGIGLDITARRRAEAEVRDLQKAAQQRERLADIGAIAAQIVHDLGNPLAGISMQAQLLVRRAERDPSQPLEGVRASLERILGEVRRLDVLIKEFMEFSREQRLDLQPVDLMRFLQEVRDLWRPVAAARDINLTLDADDRLPQITADEYKLRRVFDNLVKNAIEAIDRGPGRVGIRVVHLEPDTVQILVSDTGPGIPEAVQVFRLFETTKMHGSGIGLAVAKQIVLAHRGSISFGPQQPRGTVFRVELPVIGPMP